MDVAKVRDQQKVDKVPSKALLSAVPLSCLREVAAPLCCQHGSSEPVYNAQHAGSVSSWVVSLGDSVIATNSSDTGSPRICSLDHRRLH